MADVQDQQPAASPTQEPSMEEILASIRKIISDEPAPSAPSANNGAASDGDVLELTQMVQDDGSVVDLKAAPEPPKESAMPPSPSPSSSRPSPSPLRTPPPPPVMAAPEKPAELVSEPTASAAISSLSALASTVQLEKLAGSPSNATYVGDGARTLEEMVLELMKPMLKQWLDQNLPAAVDRLVQKEIERISRKAQD